MSDIEEKLQIECTPLSWPIGMGKSFKGVYNLYRKELNLFTAGATTRLDSGITIGNLNDPRLDEYLGDDADVLRDEIELLEGAANPFELEHFLNGSQTPIFFGSAINNFGVQEMLDAFIEFAPAPGIRKALTRDVDSAEESFSGFVFKIQANMNPAHRDRIAFMRICSGKFKRGMKVVHHRIGKSISLSNATIFMAQDRTNVDVAYAGDIIGLHNHGTIKIGDTFTDKEELRFTGIPNFAPEHFRRVILKDPLKTKQLQKGLIQLSEEGAVQVFKPIVGSHFILGAVGVLQFDVTMARLKDEYWVDAIYEPVDFAAARWVKCEDKKRLKEFEIKNRSSLAYDAEGLLTYLAPGQWHINFIEEQWPEVQFLKTMEHNS